MFTARGRLTSDPGGPIRSIAWNDGVLTGDVTLVDHIRAWARALEGFQVGPIEGPITLTDHLASGVSAVMIIADRLVDPEFSGSIPTRPGIPPGAIG